MNRSDTNEQYLVHANAARARAPLDAPLMAEFVAQVEEINALARGAAGFLAQPTLPDEGAVYAAPFLVNVSLWESVASLEAFTHQGKHAAALERRAEWFDQEGPDPKYVLFWIPRDRVVTEVEVKARLDFLGKHGATPYAFTFAQPYTAAQARTFSAVSLLMLQFLDWIASQPRTYTQALEAWRSSCPRLTVWEDAFVEGLIHIEGDGSLRQWQVALTPRGRAVLDANQTPAPVPECGPGYAKFG